MVTTTKYCKYCNKELIKRKQHCNKECKRLDTIQRRTKNCKICKKEFYSERDSRIYCSSKCATLSARTTSVITHVYCLNCNEPFKVRKFNNKRKDTNTYCSKNCYSNYCKRKQEENKIKIKPLKELKCIECNNIFYSKTQKKLCSAECERKRNYDKWIFKAKQEIKKCKFCENEFNRYQSGIRDFCSIECKTKHSKKLKSISDYPKKHRTRAKKFNVEYDSSASLKWLRDKHNNICVICNKKVLKVNKSGYHVDNATIGHIIAISQGGSHTKDNIQLECMKCNCDKGIMPYFVSSSEKQ